MSHSSLTVDSRARNCCCEVLVKEADGNRRISLPSVTEQKWLLSSRRYCVHDIACCCSSHPL